MFVVFRIEAEVDIGNIHKKNMTNQGSASHGTVDFGAGCVCVYVCVFFFGGGDQGTINTTHLNTPA